MAFPERQRDRSTSPYRYACDTDQAEVDTERERHGRRHPGAPCVVGVVKRCTCLRASNLARVVEDPMCPATDIHQRPAPTCWTCVHLVAEARGRLLAGRCGVTSELLDDGRVAADCPGYRTARSA